MIPYDDLVVALAAWRGRQGLPVAQLAGAPPAPPAPPPRATAPPPPAARTAPPSAPARAAAPRSPVSPVSNELQDFDEGEGALMEEGHYDGGDDYEVPFGGVAIDQSGEATAIGGAPEPPTEGLLVPKRGKRNPDW